FILSWELELYKTTKKRSKIGTRTKRLMDIFCLEFIIKWVGVLTEISKRPFQVFNLQPTSIIALGSCYYLEKERKKIWIKHFIGTKKQLKLEMPKHNIILDGVMKT